MEVRTVKSEEIDEIINKLSNEGSRLRGIGQLLIDASNALNEVVYYYGHNEDENKEDEDK